MMADNLAETLRASHERILCLQLTLARERKQHAARLLDLEQVLTTLRWWAVALLFWLLLVQVVRPSPASQPAEEPARP